MIGLLQRETKEIWKPIPNFSMYLVSNLGRIRSLQFGDDRLLTLEKERGYLRTHLFMDGKNIRRKVHQFVLLAFVGPVPEGMEIRHLNGIRSDNRLENLAYGTRNENQADRVQHGNHAMANKTECHKGHPFDLLNTRIGKNQNGKASRYCRTCARESSRERRAKQREEMKGEVK